MKRPRKRAPGEVTGPNARFLLKAGLDYANGLTGPGSAYTCQDGRPWYDGKTYWAPVYLALPGALARKALNPTQP